MKLGLRQVLLAVAVILFVLAALSDTNWSDYVAWGLAAFAAAFLADELGLGSRFDKRR
jgi:predicted cobalt transporter CbtA